MSARLRVAFPGEGTTSLCESALFRGGTVTPTATSLAEWPTKEPMSKIAETPEPPYYAVIFSSHRTEGDHGYAEMADRMLALAASQPGFLGIESVRDHLGITVSYWESLDSIANWKRNAEHLEAQRLGRREWYSSYRVRIAKVEREYGI